MSCLKKTTLVHEDQRLTHFASLLQKRISDAFCGGGGGGDVIWSNFLFVDKADPSLTPARGYWTRKYPTIQSAVNAAQSGDVIYISASTYTEDLNLSNLADNVTILGSGERATIIQNLTVDTPTIRCNPTLTKSNLTIQDLTIRNNDGKFALSVDCSGALASFTGGLWMMNVILYSNTYQDYALDMKYVNLFRLWQVNLSLGGYNMYNVGTGTLEQCRMDGNSRLVYDLSDPAQPSTGRGVVKFNSVSQQHELNLSGQPSLQCDKACNFNRLAGLVVMVGPDETAIPKIEFHGQINTVDLLFNSDSEYQGPPIIGNFDDAIIDGTFYFNTYVDIVPNNTQWKVTARNATFNTKNVDGIQCCASGGAPDGGRALFDMLGAEFVLVALSIDNYQVNRTLHFIGSNGLVDGIDNTISIAPPYIDGGDNYSIHPEFISDGSFPSMTISTKDTDEFVCRVDIATTCKFRLIMQEYGPVA